MVDSVESMMMHGLANNKEEEETEFAYLNPLMVITMER